MADATLLPTSPSHNRHVSVKCSSRGKHPPYSYQSSLPLPKPSRAVLSFLVEGPLIFRFHSNLFCSSDSPSDLSLSTGLPTLISLDNVLPPRAWDYSIHLCGSGKLSEHRPLPCTLCKPQEDLTVCPCAPSLQTSITYGRNLGGAGKGKSVEHPPACSS